MSMCWEYRIQAEEKQVMKLEKKAGVGVIKFLFYSKRIRKPLKDFKNRVLR